MEYKTEKKHFLFTKMLHSIAGAQECDATGVELHYNRV